MTDWLSRVFLKLLLHLVTAVEREVSILLRGKPKEQVQHATKISQADLSSTQLVRAKSTERQAHRPQLKFLTQPVPQTVVQLHRIDNSKKPEPVTRHIFGLFDFFSKYATFELSLMSNDENKFLPIFQILHIKNAWFLLELDMALVTTIEMRFALVWYWCNIWMDPKSVCDTFKINLSGLCFIKPWVISWGWRANGTRCLC